MLLLPSEHPKAGAGIVTLEELAEETWITTREGTAMASMLRRVCSAAGFEPLVSYRSNDYDVVQALVRTGLGLALVPSLGHVASPGLSVSSFTDATPRRAVLALRSPSATLATVTAFTEALGESAAQLAAEVDGVTLPHR
jgi:DNA-binding transcriptional LysR family regulator